MNENEMEIDLKDGGMALSEFSDLLSSPPLFGLSQYQNFTCIRTCVFSSSPTFMLASSSSVDRLVGCKDATHMLVTCDEFDGDMKGGRGEAK